jgi:hypothetical protein
VRSTSTLKSRRNVRHFMASVFARSVTRADGLSSAFGVDASPSGFTCVLIPLTPTTPDWTGTRFSRVGGVPDERKVRCSKRLPRWPSQLSTSLFECDLERDCQPFTFLHLKLRLACQNVCSSHNRSPRLLFGFQNRSDKHNAVIRPKTQMSQTRFCQPYCFPP